MKYCKKCGSLLYPKKEDRQKYLVCRNCGNKVKLKDGDFKMSKKHRNKSNKVVVIDEKTKEEVEALPIIEKKCPECGHRKAAWWTQQTRSGDEAPTRFYKCKNCGHKWREYN